MRTALPRKSSDKIVATITCLMVIAVSAAQAATLVGHVKSDKGRPVVGAIASVQASTVTAGVSLTNYHVITDGQGKFALDLPDGATYSVCVGSRQQQLLNSCEWATSQNLVQIPSGKKTVEVTITLITGATLRIRVNDPGNLLPQLGTAQATAANIAFGLWDSQGHYHAAAQVSSDNNGQNYEALLPLSASFVVSVQAVGVQVLDQGGKPVVAATAIPVQSQAAQIAQGLRYQVGRLP